MKVAVSICLLLLASSAVCQSRESICYKALTAGVAPLSQVSSKIARAMDSEVVEHLNGVSSTIFEIVQACDKVTDSSAFSRLVDSEGLADLECFTTLHDLAFLIGAAREAGESKDFEQLYNFKKHFIYNLKTLREKKGCRSLVTA